MSWPPPWPEHLVVDYGDLTGDDLAVFSPDRVYRYALARRWDTGPLLAWVMLNPSTADAFTLDPTLRRCREFTRTKGAFGGMVILNLFGLRATDPAALVGHPDPVGPDNDAVIAAVLADRAAVIRVLVGWGAHREATPRIGPVYRMILDLTGSVPFCLDTTKDHHPRHPLYVKGTVEPGPYLHDGP